jgi:hypothetical protein
MSGSDPRHCGRASRRGLSCRGRPARFHRRRRCWGSSRGWGFRRGNRTTPRPRCCATRVRKAVR